MRRSILLLTLVLCASCASRVYRVGNGVTAPVAVARTEPEYSEKARRAKYQRSVTLPEYSEEARRAKY